MRGGFWESTIELRDVRRSSREPDVIHQSYSFSEPKDDVEAHPFEQGARSQRGRIGRAVSVSERILGIKMSLPSFRHSDRRPAIGRRWRSTGQVAILCVIRQIYQPYACPVAELGRIRFSPGSFQDEDGPLGQRLGKVAVRSMAADENQNESSGEF